MFRCAVRGVRQLAGNSSSVAALTLADGVRPLPHVVSRVKVLSPCLQSHPPSSSTISPLFRPLFQVRAFHIRHTQEVNQNNKRGLTDASYEIRKLIRDDKVHWTGRERRITPTQQRRQQEEKYKYQIEKRARKMIIKYILSKVEARKKAKGQ